MRRKIAGKLPAWKEEWGGRVRQVGKTCSVTEFISQNYRHHILHRPMKNERARSAFDGDPTVDISSIDRLNGMFG